MDVSNFFRFSHTFRNYPIYLYKRRGAYLILRIWHAAIILARRVNKKRHTFLFKSI